MRNAAEDGPGDTISLETLKKQVLDANLDLVRQGLVVFTFGNASGIDRQQGLVVIKPSGEIRARRNNLHVSDCHEGSDDH